VIESPLIERCSGPALLLALLLGAAACNDDDAVTPPSQDTETGAATSTGATTSVGTTTSGADTTESASAGGTGSTSTSSDSGSSGSSSTGESESTTGEAVEPGRTVSQLVSAGTRTSSPSYTLVHTLGQPSSLQSTHVSTSYRLQGGLVGANGSPP
jgi:hypothetical protein